MTYKAIGTTRFREYFVQRTSLSLTGTSPNVLHSQGVVEESEIVTASGEKQVQLPTVLLPSVQDPWVVLADASLVDGSEVVTASGDKQVKLTGTAKVVLTAVGMLEDSEAVKSLDGTTTYVRDMDYIIDYDHGTIRRTWASSINSDQEVRATFVIKYQRGRDYVMNYEESKIRRTSPNLFSPPPSIPSEPQSRIPPNQTVRVTFVIKYKRETDYVMDYSAGTIRRTGVDTEPKSLIAEGQIVQVEFIAAPITRESAPVTLDVLSSARPAAPKVLYVLPTFKWEPVKETQNPRKIVSKRVGGGLRVYMERPWWSSGDGELLGVVLAPGVWYNKTDDDDPRKPYVTKWGMDPLFSSAATHDKPLLEHFKKATTTARDVALDERVERMDVAGHEVGYDAERKLWYCDLEIDAGAASYFPFIRLALARYQPNSIAIQQPGKDVRLSRVVLADFIQLAPDRSASLTFDPVNPNLVNVSVSGFSHDKALGTGHNIVEVSVERRRPDGEGELGWVPVEGATFPLTFTRDHSGQTIWTGQIKLPSSSEPLRLVIREFERLLEQGTQLARRLVYADIFPVGKPEQKTDPLKVSVTASVRQVCSANVSHELTVRWKVTGGQPPVSVTIEITGPDGKLLTAQNLPPEGERQFQLNYPSGGPVKIRAMAKDAASTSSSAQSSVQLGACR